MFFILIIIVVFKIIIVTTITMFFLIFFNWHYAIWYFQMEDVQYDNHENRLMSSLQQIMNSEQFADVTLCCADGYKLRAHKVVLSYCSSYLQVRCKSAFFISGDLRFFCYWFSTNQWRSYYYTTNVRPIPLPFHNSVLNT